VQGTAISFIPVAIAAALGLVLMRRGQKTREYHLVVQPQTQTHRYALVAIGQAVIIAGLVWLVATVSASEIQQALGFWFTKGPVGYLVAVLSLLAFASPLIAALAMLSILRHPSEMAHGGPGKHTYCFTRHHRSGKGTCKFVHIMIKLNLSTGKGEQIRTLI